MGDEIMQSQPTESAHCDHILRGMHIEGCCVAQKHFLVVTPDFFSPNKPVAVHIIDRYKSVVTSEVGHPGIDPAPLKNPLQIIQIVEIAQGNFTAPANDDGVTSIGGLKQLNHIAGHGEAIQFLAGQTIQKDDFHSRSGQYSPLV